jgi:uncharacterized membrane protein YGL010W
MSLLVDLRRQHAIDLAVYQSAHQDPWNRRLHYAMIPAEVASFLWLWTTLLVVLYQNIFVSKNNNHRLTTEAPPLAMLTVSAATGWSMGLLTCAVATDRFLGVTVLVLHVLWMQVCFRGVTRLGLAKSARVGLLVWALAWGLQIGLGHSLLEGNAPNLFNPNDDVSLLSTLTSIVLAWES